MSFQYSLLYEIGAEPVTVAEVKAYSRIDADFYSDDSVIAGLILSSRQQLELYTNLGFIEKEILIQVMSGEIAFPFGPTISIKSVYDIDGNVVDPTKYKITGLNYKSIRFNYLGEANWFYPLDGGYPQISSFSELDMRYNITYLTGYNVLPRGLKNALLAQIDYLYKSLGQTQSEPLSPLAKQFAKPYSKNLVI
jgi:uncharacterized phiE125 gp8 family phage protein